MLEVAARQGDAENGKENLLLLNKADLVAPEQRKLWAEYFMREKIDFVFFSAIEEQERIEDYREQIEEMDEEKEGADDDSEEEEADEEKEGANAGGEKKGTDEIVEEEEIQMPQDPWDIYNVDQLKLYFKVSIKVN